MSNKNDPIMLDLETYGTAATSALLAIGAVKFDPDSGELGDEFYVVVDKQSCLSYGLTVDIATEEWWSKQSPEAKTVLSQPGVSLLQALCKYSEFSSNGGLWGNGSDFDNAILSNAYRAIGMEQPWKFWDNRCYRTMKNMFPGVKMRRTGTHHNALDDAKSQALHLMEILRVMRGQ